VLAGLLANTLLGAWRLDGVVALVIAAWAVVRGQLSGPRRLLKPGDSNLHLGQPSAI
jgi:hypothetical protein